MFHHAYLEVDSLLIWSWAVCFGLFQILRHSWKRNHIWSHFIFLTYWVCLIAPLMTFAHKITLVNFNLIRFWWSIFVFDLTAHPHSLIWLAIVLAKFNFFKPEVDLHPALTAATALNKLSLSLSISALLQNWSILGGGCLKRSWFRPAAIGSTVWHSKMNGFEFLAILFESLARLDLLLEYMADIMFDLTPVGITRLLLAGRFGKITRGMLDVGLFLPSLQGRDPRTLDRLMTSPSYLLFLNSLASAEDGRRRSTLAGAGRDAWSLAERS